MILSSKQTITSPTKISPPPNSPDQIQHNQATSNEARRNKMIEIARKEEEQYNKYIEEHRIKQVNEISQLGGDI